MTRRGRQIVQAVVGIGILAACILAARYLTGPAFHERVRAMLVVELERITGGRVELNSLEWKLWRMEFEASGLTIHGLEGPGEMPYLHADRMFVRAKVISMFSREIALSHVLIEQPVLHLVAYPDGKTNQPVPQRRGNNATAQRIIDLAIGHLEIVQGRVWWNDRLVPVDVDARNVSAGMTYLGSDPHYDGEIRADSLRLEIPGVRPVASSAELRFGLFPDKVEVKAFRWNSGKSQVEGSGVIADLQNPKVDVSYKASLDVGDVGVLLNNPPLRSGRMDLTGQLAYLNGAFSSAGKIVLKDAEWTGTSVRAAGINAGAQFTVSKDRIVIPNIFGTAFGGVITGNAEIRNWRVEKPAKRGVKTVVREGSADLKLTRVQLAQFVPAVSSRTMPLKRLKPAGAAGGTLQLRWTGSPARTEARLDLDVAPPANPAPNQLPITARLLATYKSDAQTLEVARLNLATRATRLDATGMLGSTSANLRVALNTSDLAEIAPAFSLLGESSLPADVHGHASFNGTLSGKLASPVLAGHVEANNFDSIVSVPTGFLEARSPAKPARIHWDLLHAEIHYSGTQFSAQHATLRRGATQLDFDVSANLVNGRFEPNSPFTLRAKVLNAELADLEAMLGRHDPLTARFVLDVNLAGTMNTLRGDGHLQASDLKIGPEPFQALRANLRFAGREVQLNDAVLRHNGAQATGSLAYTPSSRNFRFNLHGADFDLEQFKQLRSEKFKPGGLATFTVSGSGTTEAPVLNGSARIARLVVNGEQVGDLNAEAVTRGTDLQLSARAHFQGAELNVEGVARLRGDWPANLRIRFADFNIDPLLRAYLRGRVTGHSSMDGFVYLKGPLRHPGDLNITGTVDQLSAEVEKMRIASDGPIRFSMANQVFTLERLHLVAEGTDLTAAGTVQTGGTHELNLRADGHVNMKMLQTLNPDITSYGRTDVAVSVGGVLSKPDVTGQIRIQDAGISFIDLPNGLNHVNGILVFNENRLRVRSLTAQTGGGTLDLGGFISYSNGLMFNLTAKSTDIRLRYPAGISSVASADLRFAGSTQDSRLSGDVVITKFALNSRFDFAQYLIAAKQPQSMPQPTSPLNNLHLDVHITSATELRVETTSARLSGNVDLRLRGTAAHPIVLGRVNVLDGNVSINGTKYHIERGDVTFANPTRIEPVVNMEATARIRDYDISLGIHGEPPDRLASTYRSDPPLPTADIIALLALGRTKQESVLGTEPTENYTQTASNAILGEALTQSVSSRSQKLFGLSRIKIDPQAGGPESNPNARATIEQQVSDKVTLTFITNLSQSSQQIVQVEYNVNRNLTIIAIRDQNGVVSFDVRYRQRKR